MMMMMMMMMMMEAFLGPRDTGTNYLTLLSTSKQMHGR
jgi:hypothetical protein